MGKKITVVEVCPRDGWQNHKIPIPTETKVKYIKQMIDYGATMFDRQPQMGSSDEGCGRRPARK